MSHLSTGETREDDERPDSAPSEEREPPWSDPSAPAVPLDNEEPPDEAAANTAPEGAIGPPSLDNDAPAEIDGQPETASFSAVLPPAPSSSVDDKPDLPTARDLSPAPAPDHETVSDIGARALTEAAPAPARITCVACGNETEALAYCGHCGASLDSQPVVEGAWAGRMRRAGQRMRDAVLPSAGPIANTWQLAILLLLAAIAIFALVAGYVGVALMLGAALVPLLLATTMPRLDLYGSESPLLLVFAGVGGVAVGVIVGVVMGWIGDSWWFDTGLLQFGSAGYGGQFAAAEGTAPLLVLFLNGLLLPLAALALALAIAYAMRRWHQFRNEAMDGMTLGAVIGAGWAIGTTAIFAWPVARTAGPTMSVQDWTLLTLGVVLFRPIILTGATAVIATAIWQMLLGQQRGAPQLWALVGALSVVLLGVGTIIIQPRGLQGEILWNLGLAVLVMVALRLSLRNALTFDRRSRDGEHVPNTSRDPARITRPRPRPTPTPAPPPLTEHTAGTPEGAESATVTCPNCGKLTPPGRFCANCGKTLDAE